MIALTLAFVITYFIYYLITYIITKNDIEYISDSNLIPILKRIQSYNWTYTPTFYLKNAHLQTCFGALNIAKVEEISYKEEIFVCSDNENVALHWYPTLPDPEKEETIVVIMHGMGGGSHASYIKDLIHKTNLAEINNIKFVIFNYRGCADLPLTLARIYDAGSTEDLNEILISLKSRYPKSKLLGVGYSVGGNILTKYLGEKGNQSLISGSVIISNPFDMSTCSRNMLRKAINYYFYTPLFIKILKKPLIKNSELFKELLVKQWSTVRELEYDVIIKNPLLNNRFHCIDQYHREASSNRKILDIEVPTLFVNAKDDPISIELAIPKEEIELNPNCLLLLTSLGGHLGWWEKGDWGIKENQYWTTEVIVTFFKEFLN
ncbi:AB-hydrolase YheT [Neoconidiobolus thromboides FSU 785]|nr:AB-hydrolase YheT [Neoconidiobolus thromboides FSU 785]